MAGYAKNIEFGNEQTLIQEFEIGNKSAKSFVDLGATPEGDGTNAHISRVSIGGAFLSTETDSYTQINNKEFKIAGDILLGQVKDKTMGGMGRKTYANGDIYQGEWQSGKAHG